MFQWLKQKKELRELCEYYKRELEFSRNNYPYITVDTPSPGCEKAYWTAIEKLGSDDFYKYYFTQMREKVVHAFGRQGKENSEYFRGKLSTIEEIMIDVKEARIHLAQRGEKSEV